MSDEFDPYYHWLGIPPKNQPADHYRLLGVERFETHPDVIESAADQRMAHLRSFQSGKRGKLSQRLLNELAVARATLLDPAKKAGYDQQLRARLAVQQPAAGASALGPAAASTPAPAAANAPAESQRAQPSSSADSRATVAAEPSPGDGDLLADLRDASRLAALEARRLRLTQFQLPAAHEALGERVYAAGHYRGELAAEFAALDRTGGPDPDGMTKSEARARGKLARALGFAAWNRYGAGAAEPSVTQALKRLTRELAELEAEIAKTERRQRRRVIDPRWLAILAGALLTAVVVTLVFDSLRLGLLALVLIPLAFAARRLFGRGGAR